MPEYSPRGLRRHASAPSVTLAALPGQLPVALGALPVALGALPAAAGGLPAAPPSVAAALRPPTLLGASPRAAAARARALAPELDEGGAPIAVGCAYAGADGQLFDGSRCDHLALRRRLRGGPLVPNEAANALLAAIAASPGMTAAALRDAAAMALTCPLMGAVPHDPVAASNGRTYGRTALIAALDGLGVVPDDAVAAAVRGLELTPSGAVPPATAAFVALVARLELAAPPPEDYDAAALLAELDALMLDAPPAGSAAAPFVAIVSRGVAPILTGVGVARYESMCDGPALAGDITAVDVEGHLVALGRSDGTVQLLGAANLVEWSFWPAYDAQAWSVAQIALDREAVMTLGSCHGAPPLAPLLWNTDGVLLHRLVLPGNDPVAWIGTHDMLWAHALTAAGQLVSWRIGRFAAATPYQERALGPGSRVSCNGGRLALTTAGDVEVTYGPHLAYAPAREGIAQVVPLAADLLVRMRGGEVATLSWAPVGGAGMLTWSAGPRALQGAAVHLMAARYDVWAACIDCDRVTLALTAGAHGGAAARLAVGPAPRQRLVVGRGVETAVACIDTDAPVVAMGIDDDYLIALTERGTVAIVMIHS